MHLNELLSPSSDIRHKLLLTTFTNLEAKSGYKRPLNNIMGVVGD
jgi:hypothetical protein